MAPDTAAPFSGRTAPTSVLAIGGLTVALPPQADRVYALKDVSLRIARSEILCLVGESGSGKSMLAYAAAGLLPPGIVATAGSIRLEDTELLGLSERDLCKIRGRRIGMVFQEPMTSLNPVMRVADQVAEAFRAHGFYDRDEQIRRAIALFEEVGLPDPQRIAWAYPHELSGGQRQRVVIAMALALEPELLIADEPTTALDVTTQAQILKLIDDLRRKHRMAVLFITHDFGVVAEIADRVAVLEAGELVEEGGSEAVLTAPRHSYTKRLLAAVSSLNPPPRSLDAAPPVLTVRDLAKRYRSHGLFRRGREVDAAQAVSFTIRRGETLGLVGESGSGKTTVGRCVMRLVEPDHGEIVVGDVPFGALSQSALRPHRRRIQMVFQDPYSSLNPRRRIDYIVAEGSILQGEEPRAALERARELLDLVGLPPQAAERYPHEFSGGQRQRIGIARALALKPEILVADEPVSALDVSIQAQILALIGSLQERLGLAILFITHDLRVAAQICHRIAVMRKGRIVEVADTARLFTESRHEYTRQLLAAMPGLKPPYNRLPEP